MTDKFPPPTGIKPELSEVGMLLREQLPLLRRALATLLAGGRLKSQPQLLEELLSSSVTEVLKKQEHYDSAQPIIPWTLGFARNILREWRRQEHREVQTVRYSQNLEELLVSDFALGEVEQRMDLEYYLEHLPAEERHLLRLRYLQEMTGQEIAEATGAASVNAVRVQLTRALRKLRDLITRSQGET